MSKERLAGYREALKDHGVRYNPSIIYSAGDTEKQYSIEAGYHAMKKALKEMPAFTALEAFSDTLAFGAKRALIEEKYRIPEDISLTGIDGTDLARYSSPSITTIGNDADLLAETTVKMLLGLMERNEKGQVMQTKPHLILGESTARLS